MSDRKMTYKQLLRWAKESPPPQEWWDAEDVAALTLTWDQNTQLQAALNAATMELATLRCEAGMRVKALMRGTWGHAAIGVGGISLDEAKANACLIGEAPDLLDSCIELVEANAALCRVIARSSDRLITSDMIAELERSGLEDGFGKRAIDHILKATAEQ